MAVKKGRTDLDEMRPRLGCPGGGPGGNAESPSSSLIPPSVRWRLFTATLVPPTPRPVQICMRHIKGIATFGEEMKPPFSSKGCWPTRCSSGGLLFGADDPGLRPSVHNLNPYGLDYIRYRHEEQINNPLKLEMSHSYGPPRSVCLVIFSRLRHHIKMFGQFYFMRPPLQLTRRRLHKMLYTLQIGVSQLVGTSGAK